MIYIIEYSFTDIRQNLHSILFASTNYEDAVKFFNEREFTSTGNLNVESYTLSEREGTYYKILDYKTNYGKAN
jgi:hypothetical protein